MDRMIEGQLTWDEWANLDFKKLALMRADQEDERQRAEQKQAGIDEQKRQHRRRIATFQLELGKLFGTEVGTAVRDHMYYQAHTDDLFLEAGGLRFRLDERCGWSNGPGLVCGNCKTCDKLVSVQVADFAELGRVLRESDEPRDCQTCEEERSRREWAERQELEAQEIKQTDEPTVQAPEGSALEALAKALVPYLEEQGFNRAF